MWSHVDPVQEVTSKEKAEFWNTENHLNKYFLFKISTNLVETDGREGGRNAVTGIYENH